MHFSKAGGAQRHATENMWRDDGISLASLSRGRNALAALIGAPWLILCIGVITEPLRIAHSVGISGPKGATHESFLGWSPTAWAALLTLAIAAIAAIQACIYWQMHAANKVVQRAYVYVRNIVQFEDFEIGETPSLLLEVVNSGATLGRVIEAGVACVPVKAIEFLPRPMPDPGMRASNMMLVAQQQIQGGNSLGPVEKSDHDAVFIDDWKLVVFGRITYQDVLAAAHHTDFSFVYNPKQWGKEKLGFVIDPNGYSDAD
jgi:hypothetical protein